MPPSRSRALAARARSTGAVLLVCDGRWAGATLHLTARVRGYTGLSARGQGRVCGIDLLFAAHGRGCVPHGADTDGRLGGITVGLEAGSSASSGSITIVGDGDAQVTFELPLTTRTLVKAGQKVSVTPAGSSTVLNGTLTGISALETSGTAGDTPTYTAIVTASDPGRLLASGARASVRIPVKTAVAVVRVPASAVTPTGTGTGTVQVVTNPRADTASTVSVTTGAVGGGWIEITQGVAAGDLVVLADNTAALPANSTNRRTTTTTSPNAGPGTNAPSATPSGGVQPSAAPSASPTR